MKKLLAMLAVVFTAIIVGSTPAEAKVVNLYFGPAACQVEKKGAYMCYGKNGVIAKFDTNTLTIVKAYYPGFRVGEKLTIRDFEGKFRKKLEAAEKAAEEAKISPADKKRMRNFKNLKITIKRSKVGTKPQVTIIDKKTGERITEGVYYTERYESSKTVYVDNDKYLGERDVRWIVYDDINNYKFETYAKVFPYTGTAVRPAGYYRGAKYVFEKKIGKKWKRVKKAVKPGTYRFYFKAVKGGGYTGMTKKPVATFKIMTWKQIDKMKKYNFKSKPGTKKFEKEFLKRWNKVKTIAPFSDGWGTGALEDCYPTYKYTKKSRMLEYAWECSNYAGTVCEMIYGKKSTDSIIGKRKSIKDAQIGDMLFVTNHVCIVIGKKNGKLLIAEGNAGGNNSIGILSDNIAKEFEFLWCPIKK